MKKPVVLIVDDVPDFGLRLKDAFALSSMWGCVFVDDLTSAWHLLRQDRNEIKVLLTDWRFHQGYSQKLKLYDGVDLIARVEAEGLHIQCFLMTAEQGSPSFARKAHSLRSDQILYKQDFELSQAVLRRRGLISPGYAPGSLQPWDVIATNVVKLSDRKVGQGGGDDMSIRTDHQPSNFAGDPSMIYIQELSSGLKVKKPIPAVVERIADEEEVVFRASAPLLGLLIAGYGDDPLDAIKELQDLISNHFLAMKDRSDLLGAAKNTQSLLKQYVAVQTGGTAQSFRYG